MGSAQRDEGKRRPTWFNWKKFAIVSVALILVIYFFGPRRETVTELASESWSEGMKKIEHVWGSSPGDDDEWDLDHSSFPSTGSGSSSSSKGSSATDSKHPTSFSEDPDPSKSTYCPSKGTSAVKWGLMIDAGSTGSRIHVYKFNTCLSTSNPAYEYEVFKMLKPGLSSFGSDPTGAAKSLDPLLEEALRVVPSSQQKCTPVAVKATCGDAILDAVRKRLETPAEGRCCYYGWKDEGGTIGGEKEVKGKEPFAVLDLGGGSTQIVFQPKTQASQMEPGEHKFELSFAGRKHELYQHSYLGYGLMSARESIHQLVTFMHEMRDPPSEPSSQVPKIANPCLARSLTRTITLDKDTPKERKVLMDGADIGSFDSCLKLVELVLAKNALCETKPCSFSGVYQPSLLSAFEGGRVLLLSYFYDRLAPLIDPKNPSLDPSAALRPPPKKGSAKTKKLEPLRVSHIASYAKTICNGPQSYKSAPAGWTSSTPGEDGKPKPSLHDDLDGRPEWCLDLTFMYGILRLGYEFGDEQEVWLGKRIGGTELGWSLGAGIAVVGGGEFKCTA
ncbi:nucleoside phosphatase family-domain-containing protein [Flagelloscypha sp. PMI_526]|nr:nucleoside phosphatase family-domain-containing protein [Flagelloscypha sp. PMI_526]